jgi:hypothetical protein
MPKDLASLPPANEVLTALRCHPEERRISQATDLVVLSSFAPHTAGILSTDPPCVSCRAQSRHLGVTGRAGPVYAAAPPADSQQRGQRQDLSTPVEMTPEARGGIVARSPGSRKSELLRRRLTLLAHRNIVIRTPSPFPPPIDVGAQ